MFSECPVCHQRISWTHVLRPLWSRWRCKHCGSQLGVDLRRRLLAIAPLLVLAVAGVAVPLVISVVGFAAARPYLRMLPQVFPILVPVIVVVSLGGVLLFDRPRVLERCGLRCRGCGYDLQGQVEPRCPECARELDAEERAALAAGDHASVPAADRSGARKWAVVLVALLAVMVLVQGILVFWGTRRYAARRAAATQPMTIPSVTVPP